MVQDIKNDQKSYEQYTDTQKQYLINVIDKINVKRALQKRKTQMIPDDPKPQVQTMLDLDESFDKMKLDTFS